MAQVNLGLMYINGTGVRANPARGVWWLRKAARKGDAKGMYNVSLAYLYGVGVQKNSRTAKRYMEGAADAGDSDAKLFLRKRSNEFSPQ